MEVAFRTRCDVYDRTAAVDSVVNGAADESERGIGLKGVTWLPGVAGAGERERRGVVTLAKENEHGQQKVEDSVVDFSG